MDWQQCFYPICKGAVRIPRPNTFKDICALWAKNRKEVSANASGIKINLAVEVKTSLTMFCLCVCVCVLLACACARVCTCRRGGGTESFFSFFLGSVGRWSLDHGAFE